MVRSEPRQARSAGKRWHEVHGSRSVDVTPLRVAPQQPGASPLLRIGEMMYGFISNLGEDQTVETPLPSRRKKRAPSATPHPVDAPPVTPTTRAAGMPESPRAFGNGDASSSQPDYLADPRVAKLQMEDLKRYLLDAVAGRPIWDLSLIGADGEIQDATSKFALILFAERHSIPLAELFARLPDYL